MKEKAGPERNFYGDGLFFVSLQENSTIISHIIFDKVMVNGIK